MTFAATLAGAISYAAQFVLFGSLFGGGGNGRNNNGLLMLFAAITAPIAAMLIQLAISRSRESRADEVGARTIGDPESLASALEKLESANVRHPMTTGSPASSSLFIVNPFRSGSFASLLLDPPPHGRAGPPTPLDAPRLPVRSDDPQPGNQFPGLPPHGPLVEGGGTLLCPACGFEIF